MLYFSIKLTMIIDLFWLILAILLKIRQQREEKMPCLKMVFRSLGTGAVFMLISWAIIWLCVILLALNQFQAEDTATWNEILIFGVNGRPEVSTIGRDDPIPTPTPASPIPTMEFGLELVRSEPITDPNQALSSGQRVEEEGSYFKMRFAETVAGILGAAAVQVSVILATLVFFLFGFMISWFAPVRRKP